MIGLRNRQLLLLMLCLGMLATFLTFLIERPVNLPALGITTVLWLLVIFLVDDRFRIAKAIRKAAAGGLGDGAKQEWLEGVLTQLTRLLHDLKRREEAISTSVFDKQLSSRDELSHVFTNIVNSSYKLLAADSAELSLFSSDSEAYHTSLLVGRPFKVSAQAMLSSSAVANELVSPDVLIQPISFAGQVFGTIRIKLGGGKLPTKADKEVLNLLGLSAGLALINAEYSHQLLKMQRYSDESQKAKTGFLANLSHEIRGPLGIILNAVELVLDGLCGPLSNEQVETLRMANNSGLHLLELINDVLDYAKAESGKMQPKLEELSLSELLSDLTGVVRSQAVQKKHKLTLQDVDPTFAVLCDRRHFRQILINILTNAIKYTPEGGTIDVWAERDRGHRIKINVKDSGVGISAEDHSKVFSAFERIEDKYSINQLGTGLGMPLSKKLAEINSGQLQFESEPGKGSCFALVLGSCTIDLTKQVATQQEVRPVNGASAPILLLSKVDSEREIMRRYLLSASFRVYDTDSRIDALEILRSSEVALIIVDSNFFDKSDDTLVSELKRESQAAVLLVSSHAFVFDVEQQLRMGVDRHLAKPVELKTLAYICKELIDHTGEGPQPPISTSNKNLIH